MSGVKPAYLANAALSGLLFGAGLYVSQMIDPLKVLRFLDFGAILGVGFSIGRLLGIGHRGNSGKGKGGGGKHRAGDEFGHAISP